MLVPATTQTPESAPAAAPPFERVFADHAPQVWRALRRLGVDARDVDDVCQEVFATVHRRLPTFGGRSALSTWIYGICLHKAWAHRRTTRRRREELGATPPEPFVEAPQLDALQRRRALAFADALLDTLDDDKRAVFVLYEIEEMPMKEVAEAVGCPLQTAYARLHAARLQFEAALRRAGAQGRSP